ncbi:MAG: RagB/SusD family nutrient uptake outer membrane protein [Candidatus Amulumruptor caecigallinarius]|nr:RagB/SusD family nutrient uptake outer membrane protein [Candidatus Amulumruptor caecigallinarius]
MKKVSLYTGCAALMFSGMFTACSSSYLDTTPGADVPNTELSDPSVAKEAVAGMFETMNQQYQAYETNQNCGEATMNNNCNEAFGDDFISGIWNTMPGLRGWERMGNNTSYANGLPWMYYYGLIGQANNLIAAIPATSQDLGGLSGAILLYKAQALTIRAHAYTKLMTYFGQRWEDSDNGEAYCMVLRKEPGTDAAPLAKMNQVFDLIYADVAEAEKLYDASGLDRAEKYECNKSVAQGTLARAALLKHDWATAAKKAKEARAGYTIMNETELFAGFFTTCNDFMWEMNPIEVTTYYWSWGSHYACNGQYVKNWGYGAGAINIDLYNKMDKKDIRRKFFFTPDKIEAMGTRQNPGKLKADAFWNKDMVSSDLCSVAFGNVYDKNTKKGGLIDCVVNWAFDYLEKTFTGDRTLITPTKDGIYNYLMITYNQPDKNKCVRLSNDAAGNTRYGQVTNITFGGQCKFWSITPYGNGSFPWMRASEMVLTEAEALYMSGDENGAKAALTELMSKRVSGYTCKTSGQALLDEIRTNRRVELWGEGFAFTDLKRWNMPRIRREWVAGDPTSGNVPPGEGLTSRTTSPSYNNGWRFTIPLRETQYNSMIDLSQLKKFGD